MNIIKNVIRVGQRMLQPRGEWEGGEGFEKLSLHVNAHFAYKYVCPAKLNSHWLAKYCNRVYMCDGCVTHMQKKWRME